MIRSMTGYGRAEVAGERLSASVECKSVNHRGLDIALRVPRALGEYELEVRRRVQEVLHRGRVEVSIGLTVVPGAATGGVAVDLGQARSYAAAANRLGLEMGLAGRPSLEWLLEQPGVMLREEQPTAPPEEAWPLVSQALARALGDLVTRREAEGKALAAEFRALHDSLVDQVARLAGRVPEAQKRRADRLSERVEALLAGRAVDEGRLAMEVALLAERSDVTEELARLRAHLDQLASLLETDGPVGRTLDFLIQEMNREVNTIGAKADDLELSQAVIAAKATLEKLREQAQNLE